MRRRLNWEGTEYLRIIVPGTNEIGLGGRSQSI